MIDIVRDYAGITIGSAQASTNRAVGAGHSAVRRVGALATIDRAGLGATLSAVARSVPRNGDLGPLSLDVDAVISRLGLVKTSELNAVRHQLLRIERRLGEVRGER